MGGEQALAAAGSDPRIRAVVAEGAEGQQLADRGWRPHDITGILDRGMEWVQYTAAGLLSGAPRPMSIPDAIRAAAPRPVLIIAGGGRADEPAAARWFQAASPATVQVWIVPGAGHTQGLATAPRAWEAHVIGFLDAALSPSLITAATQGTRLRAVICSTRSWKIRHRRSSSWVSTELAADRSAAWLISSAAAYR